MKTVKSNAKMKHKQQNWHFGCSLELSWSPNHISLAKHSIQHNKRSTASLAAVELSSGVEEDNGGRGKALMCTSRDISMRQLLFIWPFCKAFARLDLHFLSVVIRVAQLCPNKPHQTVISRVRCVFGTPRGHQEGRYDLSRCFLIRVLSFKAELVLTTESTQQWVWTDRRWGETQKQMKQHLLD